MLTPSELENPQRQSGYSHVGYSHGSNGSAIRPYQAVTRITKGLTGSRSVGPRRATALEAAQDYCDYVNAGGKVYSPPTRVKRETKPTLNLNRARHPRRASVTEGPKGPQRVTAAGKALRTVTPGYVYLIGITGHADYVKVGWSQRQGFPRLNELQTGNPLLLVGLAEIPGTLQTEYDLHSRYEQDNVLNEWFTPSRELLAEFDMTRWDLATAVDDKGYIIELVDGLV